MSTTPGIELTAGSRLLGLTETAAHAFGARLCYGDLVQHGDCAVIPVARLATAGGLGFGRDDPAREGGGGGGILGSRPVGFIEIADGTARFRRIVTTTDVLEVIGAAVGVAVLLGRARRRRRRR